MIEWWVNLKIGCGLVVTDLRGIIIETMPLLKRFRGQPLANLEQWPQFTEKVLIPQDHRRSQPPEHR